MSKAYERWQRLVMQCDIAELQITTGRLAAVAFVQAIFDVAILVLILR